MAADDPLPAVSVRTQSCSYAHKSLLSSYHHGSKLRSMAMLEGFEQLVG